MLTPKVIVLRGTGENCARSRSAYAQADLVEFEKEILEAIAQMETDWVEATISNEDQPPAPEA